AFAVRCRRFSVYFFFPFSVHHRDLHSFPTRRSSDLTMLFIPIASVKGAHVIFGSMRYWLKTLLLLARGMPRGHRRWRSSEYHMRSEEHTSELQSRENLVCRLLLEKKKATHSRAETAR